MSEKEIGKATSHLPTAIEEHKSNDSGIIDIPESLEREVWSKCCIQRVPRSLRKVNKEAYTPQFVSIGPFHHGEPELLGMESHKRRYLDKFCKRFGKNEAELIRHFHNHYGETLQSYAGTVKVKGKAFIEMVLVDACFIIELFLRNSEKHKDDYILNTHRIKRDIKLDLIMLENQLPYAFLKQLYDFVYNTQSQQTAEEAPLSSSQHHNGNGYIHNFSKLACKFFEYDEDVGKESDELEIKHFTDLVRRALCPLESDKTGRDTGKESETLCPPESDNTGRDAGKESENCLSYLCSAKQLDSAGVHFFKSKNCHLADLDIMAVNLFCMPCFKSTWLGFPEFCVEDETECLFRNVMALEQCLYPQETYICDYIFLLAQLIKDTEDVDLLVEKKIVRNLLGSNGDVAKLVNKLGEGIVYDDERYKEVCQKLNAHCNNWLNRTRATIKRVYFKDCWTGSPTIVGFISTTIKELFFG